MTVLMLVLPMLMVSCSTDVDLYADYKDIPVIYGILDYDADTNYIKITHAITASNNALNDASDPLQSDYPGKLDVRLTEFCNGDSVRQIVLDTITIHDKEQGIFYAPAQKLYYTTARLHKNTALKNYHYRLTVVFPDRTLLADEDMVGSNDFRIQSTVADFSGGYMKRFGEFWFIPAKNAGIYDIKMTFSFLERRSFTSDTVKRTVEWSFDDSPFFTSNLEHHMHGDAYVVYYSPDDLYDELERILGDDTLVPGLRRYITDNPIKVTLQAGGENMAKYRYFISVGMYNDIPNGETDFTVIDGAYGVFSTKATITKEMKLGGTTIPELVDSTKWGFKYIGGVF